tara:strand:+ start:632 stop:1243 length:612 start_codon:yes stop_codon:yes gene_type:complete
MSLIKLNNRSLGDNAVTASAIASNAITTDKIANNTVTQSKIDSLGAVLYSWDNSVASATASGYRTMSSTLTLPSDSVITNDWAGMVSVTFFGYISSGAHYWAWRVYDVTANSVVQPIDGPCSYHWSGAGGVGGFRFRGQVHNASQQPARIFDISGRGGNGITLELTASNGGGSTNETSSQTLYADQIFWYGGAMTGMHNENGY